MIKFRIWLSDIALSFSYWVLDKDSDAKHKMYELMITRYNGNRFETLELLFRDQMEFSTQAIGEERSPTVFLEMLHKMVSTTITDPFNSQYYAEVLLLFIDSYVRIGGDPKTLIKLAFDQLEENQRSFESTNPK